jgi:hypothetical protein
MALETIEWFRPVDKLPEHNQKCLVHAINQWFMCAIYDTDNNQFWDKDGQPVVGVIEWSLRVNRAES